MEARIFVGLSFVSCLFGASNLNVTLYIIVSLLSCHSEKNHGFISVQFTLLFHIFFFSFDIDPMPTMHAGLGHESLQRPSEGQLWTVKYLARFRSKCFLLSLERYLVTQNGEILKLLACLSFHFRMCLFLLPFVLSSPAVTK